MNIKHLEVKREYYNDPENVVVQFKSERVDDWLPCTREPDWSAECYRIKPKTIRIGEIDVPEPVRETPENGQRYFVIDHTTPDAIDEYQWRDDDVDNRWLSRGLIHLTKEAAELHAKALILVSGGKINE